MKTLLLKNDEQGIEKAAAILKNGGLVAMPTETVYGLSADALKGESVKKIFSAKGRPADNPLIVHVADIEDIERLGLVKNFDERAKKLFSAFSPGPLTVVMEKSERIPDEVSAALSTVAIRIPSHETARALIKKSGLSLAAPSANSSGLPSPTTAAHVMADMNGKIDAVLDGGACSVGVESTVITLATKPPRILRPGVITKEEIEAVIGAVEVDPAVLSRLKSGEKAASPGMKYQHYAPKADVILVRANDEKFVDFINKSFKKDKSVAALCYDTDREKLLAPCISLGEKENLKQQAQRLFGALRAIDEIQGVSTVYARCPKATGVGMALYNRMIRAAAYRLIEIPSCRIIGLCGQTGAGKGEVAKIFEENGIKTVDCDCIARKAVEDKAVLEKMFSAFPKAKNEDGTLDRRAVARLAFSDEKKKNQLNAITHPKIVALMLKEAETLSKTDDDIVVFDAPTLFDANAEVFCEKTIAVLSDEEKRIDRLLSRDRISKEEAMLRSRAQRDDRFYRSHCDFIIENNTGIDELKARTLKIIERLRPDEQKI